MNIRLSGALGIYIPCILSILCLYSWWIGLYHYDNEFILGLLILIIGLLYISAFYAFFSGYLHPIIGSCILLCTLIPIIFLPIINKFKHKDQNENTNNSSFLCLGITPLISGICFSTLGSIIIYGFLI